MIILRVLIDLAREGDLLIRSAARPSLPLSNVLSPARASTSQQQDILSIRDSKEGLPKSQRKIKREMNSAQWLNRQSTDKFVQLKSSFNYRSRAAFKLFEIQQRFRVMQRGNTVLDLGAAPGGALL